MKRGTCSVPAPENLLRLGLNVFFCFPHCCSINKDTAYHSCSVCSSESALRGRPPPHSLPLTGALLPLLLRLRGLENGVYQLGEKMQ